MCDHSVVVVILLEVLAFAAHFMGYVEISLDKVMPSSVDKAPFTLRSRTDLMTLTI